jgi:hypothetical protein
VRARSGLALAIALGIAGCRADPSAGPSEAPVLEAVEVDPPPPVDHEPPAYAGVWIGPELQLMFAGPWVLIGPREPGPGAQPIELRASVERREGDAYALRTSVADRYAGDFVRPSDWTLLVEAEALALAMGDEPLTAYEPAPDTPMLIGPVMLGELAIPETIAPELLLACVEFASQRCRALEAEGPRALGCREALWATCVAHDTHTVADPTLRAAITTARSIHAELITLRFCAGLLAAAPDAIRPAAAALHQRARDHAQTELAQLRAAGPLPSDDPHLRELEAILARP